MRKFIFLLFSFLILTYTNLSGVADAKDSSSNYRYEGEKTKEGLYEGKGKLFYKDELFYHGDFKKNLFEGKGTLYHISEKSPAANNTSTDSTDIVTNKIKYKGNFKKGLYHGKGILYYQTAIPNENHVDFDGTKFKGKFMYGEYNGFGTRYDMDGSIIEQGYFINGTLYKYVGKKDKEGKMHGKGKLLDKKGKLIFKGDFNHGEIQGTGTLYNEEHTWKYYGTFKHDLMEGTGEIYMNGSLYYKGELGDGLKEGIGTLYFPHNEIAYKGKFENDRSINQPFQIKSELQLAKDMSAKYTVYVVLLNKYKTTNTLNYFKKLRKDAMSKFETVKVDTSNSTYTSFKATKEIKDLTETFVDDFLGFNFVAVKTKLMIYNQYEVYGYLTSTQDSNLKNINYELHLPKDSKKISVDKSARMLNDKTKLAWLDITNTDYKFAQFQVVNTVNILITISFFLVLIGGVIFFGKKKRKQANIK